MSYPNGLIPDGALVYLSTTGRLPVDAAASYERMRAHALRDGVDLRPTSSADAHRTRSQQERVFFARYVPYNTGTGDRRLYNGRAYWRLRGVASAAVPGTSNHGNEDPAALDLTGLGGFTGRAYRWLAEHGAEYGWVNPDWARNPRAGATPEPWHWEYSRSRDKHLGGGGGAAAPEPIPEPEPITPEEDTMPFRILVGSAPADQQDEVGKVYLCAFGPTGTCMFQHIGPSQNLALDRAGVPLRKVVDGGQERDFSLLEKDQMRLAIVQLEAKWKVAP